MPQLIKITRYSVLSWSPDLPLLTNLQQPIHTLIISCAGVTPMFCLINVTPFYRIPVNILDLLPHHFFILYPFRMHALLPELVSSICFVCFLVPNLWRSTMFEFLNFGHSYLFRISSFVLRIYWKLNKQAILVNSRSCQLKWRGSARKQVICTVE